MSRIVCGCGLSMEKVGTETFRDVVRKWNELVMMDEKTTSEILELARTIDDSLGLIS